MLALRLIPNWLEFCVDVALEARAVIVFAPDVRVLPLTLITYPLVALVDALIVDVLLPVVAVVREPSATVALDNVKVSVSSTLAVTVICPAVEDATDPASIAVVQASSEYVVIRAKNELFVALGFTTFPKVMVVEPVGAATFPVFFSLNLPAVEVFTVQPDASPRFVG